MPPDDSFHTQQIIQVTVNVAKNQIKKKVPSYKKNTTYVLQPALPNNKGRRRDLNAFSLFGVKEREYGVCHLFEKAHQCWDVLCQ